MKHSIVLLVFSLFLYANECEERLFSLQAYQKRGMGLSVENVLRELSYSCHISIAFQDTKSKKVLKKKLDFVNIKDYTFTEFLDFLFDEVNLFYTYTSSKNSISVSYLQSKTYSIDYINVSKLTSTSSKSITSGSSLSSNSDSSGSGSGYNNSGSSSGSNTQDASPSNDVTEIITESTFTFWDNLKNNILKLFPKHEDIKIFLNKDAALLTITANKKQLKKIDKYLAHLMRKMHKQVLVEAKIIELYYNDSSATGIDWSQLNLTLHGSISNMNGAGGGGTFAKPGYELTYSFATEKFLNFLNKYGDVKILSNPKVLTLNNQPAVINVGEELSYKYQTGSVTTTGGTAAGTNTFTLGSTFVGITLYVIPEVSDNNEIIMKINPVISSLSNDSADTDSQIGRELPPDIKVKQMTSIVRVKNNDKIIIGGLVSVTKGKVDKDIPLLGSLPLIGTFFSHKSDFKTKSEMFILLVPKIIETHNMPTLDELHLEDAFNIVPKDSNDTL